MRILLVLTLLLSGCAPHVVYLSERDKIYLVKQNTDIPVVFGNEAVTIKTDRDMVLLDHGRYLDIIKDANYGTTEK